MIASLTPSNAALKPWTTYYPQSKSKGLIPELRANSKSYQTFRFNSKDNDETNRLTG